MKFSFHNKINIKVGNREYIFYNSILESLLEKLSSFDSFNNYLALGNGEENPNTQNQYHLTNFIAKTKYSSKQIQSDISKGILFTTLEYKFNKSQLNCNFLTEAGLCDNSDNPKIYNYFSFISSDTPNGIDITKSEEIAIAVTIYLTISENNDILLTAGNNKFIEYLLGNGLGEVRVCSGSNYADNTRISRKITNTQETYPCEKSATITNNSLTISFDAELKIGEINEIVFLIDNEVFARKNVKEFKPVISSETILEPKANYVVKIDEDVKSILEVSKTPDNMVETNYFVSKFANSFGDEVYLSFNNLFDSTTSRFISKDGKLIFFILNNKVYCYKNENYILTENNTREITEDNITKIIAFDNFVFIISSISPYISTYIIENDKIKNISNNFASFEKNSELQTIQQIDISRAINGNFLIGMLTNASTALTIYATYNEESGFSINSYLENSKKFNYVLAMHKNNFCDAQMIYLREGESSASCRIVTHSSSATETDVYSFLAYELTNNSTKIYTKDRAIISEKKTSPNIVIYYYPQVYKYELPIISNELKDYVSNNLNYIIQKNENNQYSIYNLIGYDSPEEFTNNISSLVDTSKIIDFEFLQDTLLIFLDNDKQKIIAYNLNLNKTQIENVSEKEASYLIKYNKYNKLGKNDETVKFKFISQVNLWFFLIKFIK